MRYAEGHHLHPLGSAYDGPDVRGNILVVCPTHHAEFDYGPIAINPKTGLVEHIDPQNTFNNKNPAYTRRDLEDEFLWYHYKVIFNQVKGSSFIKLINHRILLVSSVIENTVLYSCR